MIPAPQKPQAPTPEGKRPLWFYITVGLLVPILVMVLLQVTGVWDKAMGAPVTQGSGISRMCPAGEPCMAPYSPKRAARKFRHHKISNSGNLHYPKKAVRKINRKFNKLQAKQVGYGTVLARGGTHWWEVAFKDVTCGLAQHHLGGTWGGKCRNDEDEAAMDNFYRDLRHTEKVAFYCGSTAILTSFVFREPDADGVMRVTRKGWIGVGIGTGQCLFMNVWDKWWNVG